MAVLLMTEPSGARLPTGKVSVRVSPRSAAPRRRHDHVVRIDAVLLAQNRPEALAPLGRFPRVQHLVERDAR